MSKRNILITSGPTREYLDPVRFLTNGSSGRMGIALAEAVLRQGNHPIVVSGPIALSYPEGTEVHQIETTRQMLETCLEFFPLCDGVIGAAAPCDFEPVLFSKQKLTKSERGGELRLTLRSTPDILAALGRIKRSDQWIIGFALETNDGRIHALEKLKRKNCNLIALNSPASIDNENASLQILDDEGTLRGTLSGPKRTIAFQLLELVARVLKQEPCNS